MTVLLRSILLLALPFIMVMLPLALALLLIQIIVNNHRNKIRTADFLRYHWMLEMGLNETAELLVEDLKAPIRWFEQGKSDWSYPADHL